MRIFKYPSSKEYFDVHKFPQKLSSLAIEQLEDTGVVILWNKDGKKNLRQVLKADISPSTQSFSSKRLL